MLPGVRRLNLLVPERNRTVQCTAALGPCRTLASHQPSRLQGEGKMLPGLARLSRSAPSDACSEFPDPGGGLGRG